MRLGFFTQPVHPINRNYFEVLREDQEAIILADQLGYCEAFVGEHMTDLAEPITNCLVFLATLIDRTKHIKLGSGVINLPSYHPVHIASHVAMIDHLLEGRFLFGIGPGGLPSDVEVFGNLDLNKNEKMVEAIDQIIEIWNSEAPYNIKGNYYEISTERMIDLDLGQGVIPTPLQKPHPPIIFTALAPNSNGVTAAAERGWRGISSNYVQAHLVASHLASFLEGQRNGGLSEDPSQWSVAKSIFVADNMETAQDYARSESGPYGYYFDNILKKLRRFLPRGISFFKTYVDQPDEEVSVRQCLDTQVIIGSVDDVVEQILELREIIGPFGTLMYVGHDWVDKKLARRSMELMATEVMPGVNKVLQENMATR